MSSLSVLPIAMIPAACLILATLNSRLMPLLKTLREQKMLTKERNLDLERYFFLRIRFLQTAILCAYTAVAFFTIAAFFIILSTIASYMLYIIVILLITGCLMTFLSVLSAIVEVAYATTLFTREEETAKER